MLIVYLSFQSTSVSSFLDSTRYEECLYYLHTYGTPASIVAFYVKHSEIKMACRYVLDKVFLSLLTKQLSLDIFGVETAFPNQLEG